MMMAGIISKKNINKEKIKDKIEEEIIEIASIIKRISKEININQNNRRINWIMMIKMKTLMIITKNNKLRNSNTKRKCILIVIEAKIREGAEEEIEMRMMPINTMKIMIKAKRLTEEEDKEEEIKEEIEEVKMAEIDKSLIKTNCTVKKKNIMIIINRNHKDKIKMVTSKGK
jgi:hypothetical protein